MAAERDIVITGMGAVSPIGIGNEALWASLCEGRSGVRRLESYGGDDLPVPFGAEVADFDPKVYVRPRKSLKVMNRDIQLGFAAADLAVGQAGLRDRPMDPQRLGVVFGADLMHCELPEMVLAYRGCMVDGRFVFARWGQSAMAELYPLWMLKYLPNMPACHIGIAQDARGPNNTLTLAEVSSLAAVAEATRVIERGHADAMIVGGTGSRMHPAHWVRSQLLELSRRWDDPAAASRPFDAERDGMVNGEGAGAFVLETRQHAEGRGATVLARVLACAATFEPRRTGEALRGRAIREAIRQVLRRAQLGPSDVGHVNANGASTLLDDRIEAQAIRDTLRDVPVTAPRSYFGYLGAGGGAVEMAVSVLALQESRIPPTLNYARPDPDCPVNVVAREAALCEKPTALVLNHTPFGQAAAVLLAGAS